MRSKLLSPSSSSSPPDHPPHPPHHHAHHHHHHQSGEQGKQLAVEEITENNDQVFPIKLFYLVQNTDLDEMIRWNSNGFTFQILQPKQLLAEVLSVVFNLKKWTSFQRQLNIYGFRKIPRGEGFDGYYHPYFQRDRIDLIRKIERIPVKGKGKCLKWKQQNQKKRSFLYGHSSASVSIVLNDNEEEDRQKKEEEEEKSQKENQSLHSLMTLTMSEPRGTMRSVSSDSSSSNNVGVNSSSCNLIAKYAAMVNFPFLLPPNPTPVHYGSFFPVFIDPGVLIPRNSGGTTNGCDSDRSQSIPTLPFLAIEPKKQIIPSIFAEEDDALNNFLMQLQQEE